MFQLFQVNAINTEELVEFSQRNLWRTQYPESQVRYFFENLVSSTDFIFDVRDQKGRVSAAVLLDKVKNLSNDACLEFLGLRPDVDFGFVLPIFLILAKERTPKDRSGFQFGLSGDTNIDGNLLKTTARFTLSGLPI